MAADGQGTTFWTSYAEAATNLSPLLDMEPSKDILSNIAAIEPCTDHADNRVPELVLKAIAKHLPAAILLRYAREDDQRVESNRLITQCAELASSAATKCQSRSAISESGILIALANCTKGAGPLTEAHVEFLQCALLAGHYRFACRTLRADWPTPGLSLQLQTTLRYFYLRGIIHTGCDDFLEAIKCFWTVLSIPTPHSSQIAIDSWKKMILVKCLFLRNSIAYQSLVSTPVGASSSLSQLLTPSVSPESTTNTEASQLGISAYLELVKACHSGDRIQFSNIRSASTSLFEADNNLGLVERLTTDLEHRRVLQLASIYSTFPLSELAKDLGTSTEESCIVLSLVKGLQYSLEGDYACFGRSGVTQLPEANVQQLLALAERIRALDVVIANTRKYQHVKGDSSKLLPRGVDDF